MVGDLLCAEEEETGEEEEEPRLGMRGVGTSTLLSLSLPLAVVVWPQLLLLLVLLLLLLVLLPLLLVCPLPPQLPGTTFMSMVRTMVLGVGEEEDDVDNDEACGDGWWRKGGAVVCLAFSRARSRTHSLPV